MRSQFKSTSMRSYLFCVLALTFSLGLGACASNSELATVSPNARDIKVCVLDGNELKNVVVQYDTLTADTTVSGRPFSEVYSGRDLPYAAGTVWYINSEPTAFDGAGEYRKYGLPRILGVSEVEFSRSYGGVPIFVEAGRPQAEVLYVPVRPGCEFQPYILDS